MQIHETAFIVSTYRALHKELSKDPYACLWNNPATEALLPEIFKKISPHESKLHAIRNRFFLEEMENFFMPKSSGVFFNFGSGFSMYQFLLPDHIITVEIDKTSILEYKKEKIDQWMQKGILPKRKIEYVPIDFEKEGENEMLTKLKAFNKGIPSFTLVEGVLFFLKPTTTSKLFKVFRHLQQKNDQVGSVSYIPVLETTAVYRRLLNYFDENNDKGDSFMHQTFPHSYYNKLDGYILKKQIDEYTLLQQLNQDGDISSSRDILNEHFYILEHN